MRMVENEAMPDCQCPWEVSEKSLFLRLHTVLAQNDSFSDGRGFAPAGATKGFSDRPLETFGAVPLHLCFFVQHGITFPAELRL